MNLFAEAGANSPDLVAYLMQGAALAILAVYFLIVSPMEKRRTNDSRETEAKIAAASHEAATKARNESEERLIELINNNAAAERDASNIRMEKMLANAIAERQAGERRTDQMLANAAADRDACNKRTEQMMIAVEKLAASVTGICHAPRELLPRKKS